MTIVCLLADEDLGIGAPWECTPRCDSCGRWCRECNDEWNGDHRCQRCARAEEETTRAEPFADGTIHVGPQYWRDEPSRRLATLWGPVTDPDHHGGSA